MESNSRFMGKTNKELNGVLNRFNLNKYVWG